MVSWHDNNRLNMPDIGPLCFISQISKKRSFEESKLKSIILLIKYNLMLLANEHL